MQLIALRDWYPRFGDWTGTLIPESDRVGWVIHHTVGGTDEDPKAYARGVADYHYGRWGVPGGYNYLIGEDGAVRVMCGLAFRCVHSGTHEWNRKGLGLAFQGDFRYSPPSDVMLDAARELIGETPVPSDQWPHREVRPTYTSCPGDRVIDLLPLEVEMCNCSKEELLAKLGISAADLGAIRQVRAAAVAAGRTVSFETPLTNLFEYEKANQFPGGGSHNHDGRYLKGVEGKK